MRFRLLVLILVGASAAFAGNLPVNNPSFENTSLTPLTYSCGTNCLYSHGVTQWSTQGATGILQPGTPYPNALFNYVSNGQNVAYIDGGTVTPGRIYQYVALTAVPGVAYTLQVDFGWEFTSAYPSQFAALIVGGKPVYATGVDPTQGNWSTFSATYNAGVVDNGNPIEIMLGMYSGTEAVFDNIILSTNVSNPAPEPASLLLLASGLGLAPLVRRRFVR